MHAAQDDLPYRLGREIVRQAVLIAARDEMGLATRDETLQEAEPQPAHVVHLLARERAKLTGKWSVSLSPYPDGGVVWEKSYDFIAHGERSTPTLSRKSKRTRGALLEGLRAAGLQGTKPAAGGQTPPGPEIERLLETVDVVAQFAAVRAAHQAIASQGESPAWLGVLARGYGNLALLTNHYWNSLPEVFTARAWLYAQRMVATDPNSDLALWHRAYAWALGGTLQHALADLAELEQRQRKAAQSGAAASPPPNWAKLISAYCKCDRSGVAQAGTDFTAYQPWATMLEFLLVRCAGEPHAMFETAQQVRKVCPTAYCVYGDLLHYGRALTLSRAGAASAPKCFRDMSPRACPRSLDCLLACSRWSQRTNRGASPVKNCAVATSSKRFHHCLRKRPADCAGIRYGRAWRTLLVSIGLLAGGTAVRADYGLLLRQPECGSAFDGKRGGSLAATYREPPLCRVHQGPAIRLQEGYRDRRPAVWQHEDRRPAYEYGEHAADLVEDPGLDGVRHGRGGPPASSSQFHLPGHAGIRGGLRVHCGAAGRRACQHVH